MIAALAATISLLMPTAGTPPIQPSWSPNSSYTLELDATFNGPLNTKLWTNGWFGTTNPVNPNSPPDSFANVSQSGGHLNLLYNGKGSLVDTDGKFSFAYGEFEVRAYVSCVPGNIAEWPAIWLDGQSWPRDGEIDVLEGLGGSAAYHYHSPDGAPGANVPGDWCGWHDFGVSWLPGIVRYYYGGHLVGSIDSDIQGAPMYIILDNTSGDDGPNLNPDRLIIQWVRVWKA